MNISLETHDYDRYIGSIYHNLKKIDDLNLSKPKKFLEVIENIENETENLKDIIEYETCINVLKLITYDVSNNYDSINNISVEDILPRVWRFVEKYDDKSIFFEQLSDIWNGPCPQGRVTRFFQFYFPHIDERDPIFKKCLNNCQ